MIALEMKDKKDKNGRKGGEGGIRLSTIKIDVISKQQRTSYSSISEIPQGQLQHSNSSEFLTPALICLSKNAFRMQSAIGSALRTALNPIARPACRIVGGTRYPASRRTFHHSVVLYRTPDNQGGRDSEGDGIGPEVPKPPERENVVAGDVADVSSPIADIDNPTAPKTGRQTKSRSRTTRQRQPQGLPPVAIPDWFLERNVKRVEDPSTGGTFSVYGSQSQNIDGKTIMLENMESNDGPGSWSFPNADEAKYRVHEMVFREILATLKAGLALRPPRMEKNVLRPVTLLHFPKDGGTYYLDSLLDDIASKLTADLVRLDAQDIAEIIGPYVNENIAWTDSETSYLGYSACRAAGNLQDYRSKDHEPNEKGEQGKESVVTSISKYREMGMDVNDIAKRILHSRESGSKRSPGSQVSGLPLISIFGMGSDGTPASKPGLDWQSLKLSTALDALVGAADSKSGPSVDAEGTDSADTNIPPRDLIIQVKGYNDLSETISGPGLLRALRSVIDKRWQAGRNIILVGTVSSDDLGVKKSEIQELLFEDAEADTRTILVPSEIKDVPDETFSADEKTRIRRINLRHIQDMIMKLKVGDKTTDLAIDIESNLDSDCIASLEKDVWTYARVRRLASVIVGYEPPLTSLDGSSVNKVFKLLSDSDEVKYAWGRKEFVKQIKAESATGEVTGDSHRDKFNSIKSRCTSHERRLFGGVKIPSEIKTSFTDIHAPEETIEALTTLTGLSLLRPEAFSYGVLAKDKIPGVLLYGPPGTGKTLLATAVAKESGAIVLEVSGASVNDMYVGEGEKNVRAIFTLAKKLSPCVVFIDEADGLLAARGGSDSKRSATHREVINQFLREWDGMNEHSAFIMVATNRPYDLDEAVLRRLPRRLLVDLPLEKDRAAILHLHLQNELLDDSVSIPEIAKSTPYYSGSDLKNVCVAAALACLRDENVAAKGHAGPEPFTYPTKRTLTKAHFDKALDEISASISDDMSTLKAIRTFDEKYGDRKGRRKKTTALGFGGTLVEEKDSEAGRVRKAEA